MSIRNRLFHIAFLFMRPMTLGVRVIATNKQGHIALVRHTYVDGWHLPGGGVDNGEDCPSAALRELQEETGIVTDIKPKLHGLYFNRRASKRDHVALYLITGLDVEKIYISDREIAEARFFAFDALPDDVTYSTRRRLSEVFGDVDVSSEW